MRLRVVSLPATASSWKNRLNSSSVRRFPSTSACSRALMMSSPGLARFHSASSAEYMNISVAAPIASSRETLYSGSSDPMRRLLHSKIL
jgi:hypothetical protein